MFIVYAAAAVGLLVLILASLKGWQWVRSKANAAAREARTAYAESGLKADFRQAWSDADDFVNEADAWTPYIVGSKRLGTKPNPYAIGGIITSSLLLLFAAAGGYAIGGGDLVYAAIAFAVMATVQVIQAVVSLSGDKGTAEIWEFSKSDRTTGSWLLLTLLLVANMLMSTMGSLNVGSQAHQANVIATSKLRSDIARKEALDDQIRKIEKRLLDQGEGMSANALRTKWHATRDEAIRESWRSRGNQVVDERLVQEGKYGPKCGDDCKALQAEAAKYQQLYEDATRRPELQAQLKSLNDRLSQSGGVSTEGVAWANRLETLTGGAIAREDASKSAWTAFQLFIAMLDFFLWLKAGDVIGAARRKHYDQRAELANAQLVAEGWDPRYTRVRRDVTPELPMPTDAASIEINVQTDPAAVIAASPDLQTIEGVFRRLLTDEAGARLPAGLIYRVFKADRQAAGVQKHMGQAAFIPALRRYAELKQIEMQGGFVIGWKLGAGVQEPAPATAPVASPEAA